MEEETKVITIGLNGYPKFRSDVIHKLIDQFDAKESIGNIFDTINGHYKKVIEKYIDENGPFTHTGFLVITLPLFKDTSVSFYKIIFTPDLIKEMLDGQDIFSFTAKAIKGAMEETGVREKGIGLLHTYSNSFQNTETGNIDVFGACISTTLKTNIIQIF